MNVVPNHRESRTWYREFLLLCLVALLSTTLGCDSQLEIDNAAPRITWVAVQPPLDGESVAEVTVWISDVEGDPVNLSVEVVGEDGTPGELVLDAGGHGFTGLTTQESRFDPNGQPHLLLWDTTGYTGGRVQLRLAPDDLNGGEGDVVSTPMFEVNVGLKEAVPVEIED